MEQLSHLPAGPKVCVWGEDGMGGDRNEVWAAVTCVHTWLHTSLCISGCACLWPQLGLRLCPAAVAALGAERQEHRLLRRTGTGEAAGDGY